MNNLLASLLMRTGDPFLMHPNCTDYTINHFIWQKTHDAVDFGIVYKEVAKATYYQMIGSGQITVFDSEEIFQKVTPEPDKYLQSGKQVFGNKNLFDELSLSECLKIKYAGDFALTEEGFSAT